MPTRTGICCDTKANFMAGIARIDGICSYDAASKTEVCPAGGNSGTQCLTNSQPCKFIHSFSATEIFIAES